MQLLSAALVRTWRRQVRLDLACIMCFYPLFAFHSYFFSLFIHKCVWYIRHLGILLFLLPFFRVFASFLWFVQQLLFRS